MKIVEHPAMLCVGIAVRADWRSLWTEMPRAWRRLFARRGDIEHRQGDVFMDISLDKRGDEYLQLVCARVSRADYVPDGMRAVEVPAQSYVYHRHRGPAAGIAESFGRMYAWARESGYDAGEFKLDIGYTPQGDERPHDLYVVSSPSGSWRDRP